MIEIIQTKTITVGLEVLYRAVMINDIIILGQKLIFMINHTEKGVIQPKYNNINRGIKIRPKKNQSVWLSQKLIPIKE
ncbi:MAG: hypothetical protein WC875_02945 [Candidatus Absconditabacterales bacterium]